MSKKCKDSCQKKTSIGGQALIEGIMMRGPKKSAMAVRDPDGNIVLEKWKTATPDSKILRFPVIRGVYSFIFSMTSGYKSLMRSAEISGLEAAEEELKREKEEKKRLKAEKKAKKNGDTSDNTVDAATEAVADETKDVTVEAAADDMATDAAEAETNAEIVSEAPNENETVETVDEAVSEDKGEKSNKKSKKEKKESSALTNGIMIIASVIGVALAIGLFIMLPSMIYKWCLPIIPASITANAVLNSLVKSIFEGVFKIVILVAYMALVSLMKDIRRTFMYHGAEHKTIFCFEHGKELTVENVRREGRFHPRCGTSFLILMLIVGIGVSFFIDPLFLLIFENNAAFLETTAYTLLRVGAKILLLPIIMGLGYELIRLAGKHDNIITKIISFPGVMLQHITVLEPTDDMIECAIAAFKEVIPEEEKTEF